MALQQYIEELEPSGLIIIGAILVVIPEPATSTLGVGLVLLGIAWWFWQWR
jgi:UPF0716 family protein affecting phage T7 exclusion